MSRQRPHQAYFNPRTPRGVRLYGAPHEILRQAISIHAPREGCDPIFRAIADIERDFNPRTPRGVRPSWRSARRPLSAISIHAPREGCDPTSLYCVVDIYDFNPRTPRGVRLDTRITALEAMVFQSTHPARGATGGGRKMTPNGEISIHAPREGCDSPGKSGQLHRRWISIHAPREGCD